MAKIIKMKDLLEGKLSEGISVADTRFVGKFVIHILSSGSEMRSAILSKKNNSKYATKDKKDLKTLWDLAGKYKGKEIKEGNLTEGKRRQLQIPIMDKLKVNKILKKQGLKIGKDYDIGVGKGATFILDVDQKVLDKLLDILVANRIRVNEV